MLGSIAVDRPFDTRRFHAINRNLISVGAGLMGPGAMRQ